MTEPPPEKRRERPDRGQREDGPPAQAREQVRGDLATYRIAVGKRHKVMPGAIVGAIANEGGLHRSDFGHITIRPEYSLVELPAKLSKETLKALAKHPDSRSADRPETRSRAEEAASQIQMTVSRGIEGSEAQGGLESVGAPERVASLTGIRAVAAILVLATHAAYTTGKYTHGYVGSRLRPHGDRGSDLLRPVRVSAVPAVGESDCGGERLAIGSPLCLAPGAADHARIRGHRGRGVRGLPLPARRAEPRPHLDRLPAQPEPDADLHRPVHVLLSAPGPHSNVEPGRGSRVLRRAAAAGLAVAGGAVSPPLASLAVARRPGALEPRRRLRG